MFLFFCAEKVSEDAYHTRNADAIACELVELTVGDSGIQHYVNLMFGYAL